ncbi:cytochrome c biogenesis protein CcdA [Haloarculaceae archaeon H-GB2-1]|nr:cytochrome c biogenesis protein CcdA [Haloarculaceae archaeon H-GB1-1]MEA5386369.1 cytochrome c biogenesis protein CcdA [Haloarculaceae archaeon H-GB11]MEA5407875.1 cytochrome c biogenesis protein CcdA [Haloarculaceae archaeon H-GB2-1]
MLDLGSLRLGFAFGLGTATFFAPCAFPLLPGYVAFYLGTDEDATGSTAGRLGRAAGIGLVTSLGFFLVYGLLAGVVLAVGTRVLANVSVLELVVGAVLILLGLAMFSGRFDPSALHVQLPERRRGPTGYFLFGVVYAAAAAGCTAPLFVAIASLALSGGPVSAVATLGAYAAGMSALMVGVTMLTAVGKDTIVRRLSANTGLIRRVAGAVLVVAGVVQMYYFLFVFDGLAILLG